MLQDALKAFRRIADDRIKHAEGNVLLVSLQKFGPPKFRVAKKILLARFTAGEREPLHVVGVANIIQRRVIVRRMHRRRWNNCGQMWWKFFGRRPLIEAGIGAAPHRHFSVAKWL